MSSQERLMVVVETLVEAGFHGLQNKDIALKLGASPAAISRDLTLLRLREWVDRTDEGRYRVSPRFAGFAGTIAEAFRQARLDIQREEERFTAVL